MLARQCCLIRVLASQCVTVILWTPYLPYQRAPVQRWITRSASNNLQQHSGQELHTGIVSPRSGMRTINPSSVSVFWVPLFWPVFPLAPGRPGPLFVTSQGSAPLCGPISYYLFVVYAFLCAPFQVLQLSNTIEVNPVLVSKH
jgi:hypothetical protein